MTNEQSLTRNYIYGSLFKLLETKSYDKLSVSDICTKAGVSRMSFYRNFSSKYDLAINSVRKIRNDIRDAIENLEVKNHYTITKQFFETLKGYDKVMLAFYNSEICRDLVNLLTDEMLDDFPNDMVSKTSKYIPVYHFGAMTAVIFEWIKLGTNESPDEMARILCTLNKFDNNTPKLDKKTNIANIIQD